MRSAARAAWRRCSRMAFSLSDGGDDTRTAIYFQMRANVLQARLPTADDEVRIVLMDWHVGNGTSSVLAAADGTASIYLSSGGGFIGAGQKSTTVRALARQAVQLARTLAPHCQATDTIDLPAKGEVF